MNGLCQLTHGPPMGGREGWTEEWSVNSPMVLPWKGEWDGLRNGLSTHPWSSHGRGSGMD